MLVDKKTETIRGRIAQRLKAVGAGELSRVTNKPHLDEDTIAAFVEGLLLDNECQPVLAHLAACGACRRVSAQIVQMENQIDAEPADNFAEDSGRLESLLSKFGSLVPSTGEEVVFAYQNPEDEPTEQSEPRNSEVSDKPPQ